LNNRVLPKQKQYSTGEEILNSISHGAGAVFAACGTALLIVLAAFFSDAWGIVSSAVYGFSLIVLYTMSTLYHAITNARAKRVMRVLDHSSIFLLIAGTYAARTARLGCVRACMGKRGDRYCFQRCQHRTV